MDEFLLQAQLAGELRLFDLQFATKISQVNGAAFPELSLAAALASNRLANGDTCVALSEVERFGLYANPELQSVQQKPPVVSRWRDILLDQKVVGEPGDTCPLILDKDNRLYLGRYWGYEQSLLGSLKELMTSALPSVDKNRLTKTLAQFFQQSPEIDWQCVAAATAVLNRLCVITGGPGTGKTYTVAAILSLLEEQTINGKPPKIALAAPTGKAAARLTESVHSVLNSGGKIKGEYQDIEAVTLHRLLGLWPGKVKGRFHRDNPLPHDVVIVDEASMVDLPLMARTFEALSPSCRVVLIGDKDQLASVESGMVLGDICGGIREARFGEEACRRLSEVSGLQLPVYPHPGRTIADHIVHLQKSHRSIDSGGISALAKSVNVGDASACLKLLQSETHSNLTLLPHNPENIDSTLVDTVVPVYRIIHQTNDPLKALNEMSSVCVLCALKKGRSGAEGINRRVETLLSGAEVRTHDLNREYYSGKPIMIIENNTVQNLFNGDHGLVLTDSDTQELRVYFNGEHGPRSFTPGRLPEHQSFYAMTIHKSQGSEYNTVVVVLPGEDSPMLTRELLYTAITRARERVIVIANDAQLRTAVETQSVRTSGLHDALWPETQETKRLPKATKKKPPDGVPVQASMDF